MLAISAALLGANATAQTYDFSGTVTASKGATYGLFPAGTNVCGTYTIDFAASPQNVGGVIGSPAGWNSTTAGGPIYGTSEPLSLIFSSTLSAPVSYATAAIGSPMGNLADMGINSQLQGLAGCNGSCGYTYVASEIHYVTGTGTTGNNGVTAEAGTTSSFDFARPTLNWDSNGLPIFTPDTTATGSVGLNNSTDVLEFTISSFALQSAPDIVLVKTANIASYSTPGTLVTYSYQVTNNGTVALTGVSVTDPMPGLSPVSCPSSTLAAGASEICTATYTTTQANVDAGSISNTGTATNACPASSASSSLTIPAVQTPGIALVKMAIMPSYSAPGTSVAYSYLVTNSGNVTLTGVNVTDPMAGLSSVSCPSGTLSAGASETCTATYVTTQADVDKGSITNTGTATGTPPSGTNVTATSSMTVPAVQSPAIALLKSASIANYSAPGTAITYSYTVTNNGNVDLIPVTVTDPMSGLSAISCPSTALAPAAFEICTATYTTTAADVTKGSISNTATTTGKPQVGSSATATSTLMIPLVVPPNFTITASPTSVSVVQG
ncbi:MAG TPA: hypothetical protein VF848_04535, partial [Steroidobacteraceae bacterium]